VISLRDVEIPWPRPIDRIGHQHLSTERKRDFLKAPGVFTVASQALDRRAFHQCAAHLASLTGLFSFSCSFLVSTFCVLNVREKEYFEASTSKRNGNNFDSLKN